MKNDMLEIELRYEIDLSLVESIRERLIHNGFIKQQEIHQEDVYYTSRHKDFIISEECLRIRKVNNNAEITWKPPSDEKMKATDFFWKEEIDLNINDQYLVAKKLLNSLDFIEYCTVDKKRENFLHPNKKILVSIDKVKTAGYFVELELKHSDVDFAKTQLNQVAFLIGVDQCKVCNTPYRDLVTKE